MPDRLDAMAAFVAVCEAPGFAAAARRLHLSPSVVTRMVAGLEERLGVRLLHRTTRSIKITDAGARFLERARRILAEIEEAELSVEEGRAEPRGKLVVSAPLLFGRMHVAPLVSAYLARYPSITAELQLSDRVANLVEDGVDLAIRIGNLPDSGLIARRLGQTQRVLVASPAYLKERGGPPRDTGDLIDRFDLIAFDPLLSGPDWSFVAQGRVVRLSVRPKLWTNSADAAIGHAIGAGGVTGAYCYQVAPHVREGTLALVLQDFAPPPVPIQAVFPTSRLLSSKVRAFLGMVEQAASLWIFLPAQCKLEAAAKQGKAKRARRT